MLINKNLIYKGELKMNTKKIAFYVLAVILGGCVPSLQPLYTNNDLIFEPKLLGKWVSVDPNMQWQFEEVPVPGDAKKYYILTVTDEKGSGKFDAHLLKLDNMTFLDLFPKDPNVQNCDLTKIHLVLAHTFYKVEQIDPNFQLKTLSPDDMKKFLEKDPNAIKYEKTDNGILLTASTKDLQEFVKKNANNEDIFKDFVKFKRPAVKEPKTIEPNTPEPNSINKNKSTEKAL